MKAIMVMFESLLAYVQEPMKKQIRVGIEERIHPQGLKEIDEEVIPTRTSRNQNWKSKNSSFGPG